MMNRLIAVAAARILTAMLAVGVLVACKDDKPTPYISLGAGAILISEPGGTGTLEFSSWGVEELSVKKIPAGWQIAVDMDKRTITATAPADLGQEGSDAVRSGTATVTGPSVAGTTISASLYVSVAHAADLRDRQSHCIVLSQPDTRYTLDATRSGEGQTEIATEDVQIVWQSAADLIRYYDYRPNEGIFSFYLPAGSDGALIEGNVLLGAYDARGQLIDTWHLWIVEADDLYEQTYANGKRFMSLNLGALGSSNETHAEILATYGLYYQWGRRTPFVGALAYDAADALDAPIYNNENKRIYLQYEESDAEKGTRAYAAAHPLTFILGTGESSYDWLYTEHPTTLWSSSTKSAEDPCPKGWRVPSAADFEGLEIVAKSAEAADRYGWEMTDGTVTAYYPGAGFRPYLSGKLQNLYSPVTGVEVPMPWMGYYWTADTEANEAAAMTLWFNAADPELSGFSASTPYRRANGMQIRCVRE